MQLIANFIDGIDTITVAGLTQWDYGQKLIIKGLKVPSVLQVHFSNNREKEAIVMPATQQDDIIETEVPNVMLEETADITAWVYVVGENSGETIKKVVLPVAKRIKPQDFISHNPDAEDLLADAINKINENIQDNEEFKNNLQEKVDSGYFDGENGLSAYELAVENGFEGTEEEWLESLKYDHSDEFKQLAEQVKQDATDAENSASEAKKAMNEANTTAQANLEAIQSASQTAQSDISTAKQDAVNAVEQAQKDAEQSIATKHSEAVQAVEQAQSTAETAINAKQAESVNAVETAKEEATKAIETGKTEAVTAIETAKDNAIEEIENTGVPLEDIEKLAIKETAEGNPTIINDSADWRLQKLNIYGQSEQDSTTGAQLLDSSLYKDSATGSGVTYTKQSDGSIKRTGTATDITGNVWFGGDFFGSKDAPNYKVLFTLQAGTYTVKDCLLLSLTVGYRNTFTIEEPLEISGLRNENFEVGKTYNDVIYPMLNEGSTALPFEPYTGGKPSPSPDYPQDILSKEVSEIKVTGANILKLEDVEEATKDGITYSVKDGLIKVKGTAERDGNIQLYVNQNRIALLAGQTYIFNPNPIKGTETLKMYLDFSNMTTLGFSMLSSNLNTPITLNEAQAKYTYGLFFVYKSGQTVDMEYKPQVLMSNILLPYEPYKEQTITLSEPITLRDVPVESGGNVTIDGQQYVSDVICEKDGVIGVERNIAEVKKAKGTHFKFIKYTDGGERYFADYGLFGAGIFNSSVETKKAQVFSNFAKNQSCASGPISGQWTFDFVGDGIRVNPPLEEFDDMTAEEMNTILSSIDTVFIGLIGTPTFEPLPEDIQSQIKALKSYYPNTVIQTGCFNEVEYVADTKLYIDKKISEINTSLLNVQANMLKGV